MPTYEYICEKCGVHFDQVQPMSAKALTVCPKEVCGKKTWGKGKVKRAIGAGAGLIFKGTGFYITDYRSEGYKSAAKADAAPASADSKSGDAKPSTATKTGETKTAPSPAPAKSESSKPKPAAK